MKRSSRKPGDPEVVKTSISMSEVLYNWAERHWRKEGFNSLSSYIASLIYSEKKEEERRPPFQQTGGEHTPTASVPSSSSAAGSSSMRTSLDARALEAAKRGARRPK